MNKGLTLLELLISIFILTVVIAAIIKSSSIIFKLQVQQSEIAKTNVEEGISLEILRKDIEMAGFGLPWDMNGITYSEAVGDSSYIPDPANFNDAPSDPPRAFVLSNNGNTLANNSDVLIIKSSMASLSDVTQRWGYVYKSGGTIEYNALSPDDSESGYFVVMDKERRLEKFDYQPSSSEIPLFKDDLSEGDIYLAFGISSSSPRMPFNRVDYYLKRPESGFPEKCSPNTYELYRATINQSNGERNEQPVLNCVRDFQVVFGLDTNSDNRIDLWSSELPNNAPDIRNRVKQIRVFILYQEGKRDPNFTFDRTVSIGDSEVGTLKTFTPSGDDIHYRWNVLRVVAYPLNLKPHIR